MRTFAQKQNQPQKRVSSSLARSSTVTSVPKPPPHPLLHLQHAIGNQAVLRMLRTKVEEPEVRSTSAASPRLAHDFSRVSVFPNRQSSVQTKPSVSAPEDLHEQEADRIAERMMLTAEPLTRTAQAAEPSPHSTGSRLGDSEAERQFPATAFETLNSSAQPLESATRAFMESRFGHDFSGVRVHADAKAAESAEALGAKAYTVGQHIVLGECQRSLENTAGRHLLAHELAHVVQQSRGGQASAVSPSAPHERDAQAAAMAVVIGRPSVRITCHTGVGLARDREGEPPLPQLTDQDPKAALRYIDTLFQSVSYQWLNGASIFKWQENGKEKKIPVPLKDLVQDDTLTFVALWKVHQSKDEALKTVDLYAKAGPGFEYYSFYIGPDGVIMPTSFSIDSTPQFHALWPGLKQQIAEDAADIRKGLQPLANVLNPLPGTEVDEYGNLGVSGNPLDWVPLLKLRRLSKIKEAGPIKIKHHSGYNVPYKVIGPHGKLKGTSVYVLKDAEGTVLYVGKGDTLNRLREHIKDPKKTQWFGEISEVEVKATGLTNTQALALEQDLIGQMKPLHNVDKTPFRTEFGDAMAVGPNLPKSQEPFKFWVEWGHQE